MNKVTKSHQQISAAFNRAQNASRTETEKKTAEIIKQIKPTTPLDELARLEAELFAAHIAESQRSLEMTREANAQKIAATRDLLKK